MEAFLMRWFTFLGVLFLGPSLFFFDISYAQSTQWGVRYSGSGEDQLHSILQTADGGYFLAGNTRSFGAGRGDAWALRLSAGGSVIWQSRYGGGTVEFIESARQTQAGNYVVAGSLSGANEASADAWLMSLGPAGEILWQHSYGGASADRFNEVDVTADGGYIAAGPTRSFSAGAEDAWIVRLDPAGNIVWQRSYGGSDADVIRSIRTTPDGGFIASGTTRSFGAIETDAWVLRLDSNGTILWQKRLGGADAESSSSIQQTRDKGFIFSGRTSSSGGDGWIVKLNSAGSVMWQRRAGSSFVEEFTDIQQTSDGAYIASGTASDSSGMARAWLLRLSSNGNRIWQNVYSNASNLSMPQVRQTLDRGFIFGLDQPGSNRISDAVLLKLDPNGNLGTSCGSVVTRSNALVVRSVAAAINTSANATNSSARAGTKPIARKSSTASVSSICNTDNPTMRTGTFTANPSTDYTVTGSAVLEKQPDGSLELRLGSDFVSSNGPRLEVYLSSSNAVNSGSISLGRLKQTSGVQTYRAPGGVQLTTYDWVIIHCVSFDVSFGYAQLR